MLTNTAQADLDNNLGVTVPHFKSTEDFLSTLKIEYQQQNGSLVLPGTSGTQQLFYATTDQKNQSWLNQGLADPEITGLIIRTPLNPPAASDLPDKTRDRLTGLPLDDKGRYTRQVAIGDSSSGYTNFAPKYFSCATVDCVRTNASLDMSDPGTRAYVKALDAQMFKDINMGATAAVVVVPAGVAGGILGMVGVITTVGAGVVEDKPVAAISKEALQAAAGQYLKKIYGLGEAAVGRITAIVDLAGGWQAFIDRALLATNESKK
jgi:hypothetical protein